MLESDLNYWKNSNLEKIGENHIEKATLVQKAGFEYYAGLISFEQLEKISKPSKNEAWFKYICIPEENRQIDKKLIFIGLPYF